jgi:transposase
MAGKPKHMSQIKQLIQMHQKGAKIKTIARVLAISKNTVKGYLIKLETLKESLEELLKLDDPILESRFHSGDPAYCDKRYAYIEQELDYYSKELTRPGVTRKLLWEEYREKIPDGYGLTQFCFHLNQHLLRKSPSMVMVYEPGQKLYVDFAGKTEHYIDRATGEVVRCQLLVACLPYSDYGFAIAVPSQKISDFLHALEQAFIFFGGVAEILVTDNLKSAVTKADRYEPDINRTMDDFANHYGIAVMPTRAMKPKDKALVENHVKMFYTHIKARMRNEQHFSLESLNESILKRVIDHNQTRMQRKPYSRTECFLSEEKPLLKPMPAELYEHKSYRSYKVAKNNFIYVSSDKHYYSVPYTYIGKRVEAILTSKMLKVYHGGKQIAQHLRSNDPRNLYVFIEEHLCSSHRYYRDRSPDYYIKRGKYISAAFGDFIANKFACSLPPETLYRSCEGLIRLAKNTEPAILEMACRTAELHGNYSMKYLQNVIKNKTYTDGIGQEVQKPLPAHANIRGKKYYQHPTNTKQLNLFNPTTL